MNLLNRLNRRREAWLAGLARALGRRRFSPAYFEQKFRAPDPWGYNRRAYEVTKYEQTLEALRKDRYECALEIACAEGVFTQRLSSRAHDLLAVDIAQTAISRAQQRLAAEPHVLVRRWDLFLDPPPGKFDLIVCSEVLCFAENDAALHGAAARIIDMLLPGGDLVLVHLRIRREHDAGWDADDLLFGADSIHPLFLRDPRLQSEYSLTTDQYEILTLRHSPSPSGSTNA